MPWPTTRRVIGTKVPRLDGPDKSTGRAKYSFDISRPGMLHGRILRCPHARAKVKSISTAACEQTAGFKAVHEIAKANDELYFSGAEVVAVAADTEEHAEDCLRAIRVEYEVLPHYVKEADGLNSTTNTAGGAGMNNIVAFSDFTTT